MTSYFTVSAACVLVAVVAGWGLGYTPDRRHTVKEFRPLLLFVSLCALVYALLGCFKYYEMRYGAWDFGIWDSMIHNAAHFDGLFRDFRGPFDHFSPLVLILVPLYWIYDHPLTLVFAQSAILAGAAIPLYLIGRRWMGNSRIPLLVTLMYLLNPYYSRLALYDFHFETLFPLLFFLAWLAHAKKKPKLFALLLLCCPLIKEEMVIPLGACGLLFCSRRKTRALGILCLAATVLISLFVVKIWFPVLLDTPYRFVSRYSQLLGSDLSTLPATFSLIVHQCLGRDSLAVILSLLMPFAFLPLLSCRVFLLLMCPVFFVQFLSNFQHQQLLQGHYSSTLLGVVPIAALQGGRILRVMARRLRASARLRRQAWAAALTLAVVVHVCFCDLPGRRYHNYIQHYLPNKQFGILSIPIRTHLFTRSDRVAFLHELFRQIPVNASIVTQNNLAVYFMRNKRVILPGNPFEGSDVFLFDLKLLDGFDSMDNIKNILKYVESDPDYECLLNTDGIVLFHRMSTVMAFQPSNEPPGK